MLRRISLVAIVLSLPLCALGADWPQFRGAGATASSDDKGLPETWDAKSNLLWKVQLPGHGASSPIVLGDRIYLTTYSGYGVNPGNPGELKNLVRHLVCLNKADGSQVWKTDIKSETPEARYGGMMTQHGYASNSPATDGQKIYVFLGTAGVYAFDLAGKEVWHGETGNGTDGWGSGSSVCLDDDVVIVNAAIECEHVLAFDKKDGHEAWRFKVPKRSWSTPAVVSTADGRKEVVVNTEGRVSGIDPKTGAELWHCAGIADYTCPSVIAGNGVAYISGGRSSAILAVKVGGSGDVEAKDVLWRLRLGANVPTPVLFGNYLFGASERGIAFCVDAETGKIAYQERIAPDGGGRRGPVAAPAAFQPGQGGRGRRGGPGGFGGGMGMGRGGLGFYASPVAADGKVFAVTRSSGTLVFAAEPEYKLLATNKLDGDRSTFDGTPAISDGKLFLRSNESLYCIGKKD
jgi:outer membrane protein assembly factor BamB